MPAAIAWGTLRGMRALRSALLLLPLCVSACQDDGVGGVDVTITRASVDANPGAPMALVALDLTIELYARDLDDEVTLSGVRIIEQPISDGSPELGFMVEMRNTEDDGSVVRLDGGSADPKPARVNNVGTTNAELVDWCRKPVQLVVTVESELEGEAEATQDITVRCP